MDTLSNNSLYILKGDIVVYVLVAIISNQLHLLVNHNFGISKEVVNTPTIFTKNKQEIYEV